MRSTVLALSLVLATAAQAQPRPAPVREVRTALEHAAPEVQRCAAEHPPPGTGRSRRIRMRIWLYPNGRWNMDVPELANANSDPNLAQLQSCLSRVIAIAVAPQVRPFTAATRTKAERTYVVHLPGPAPPQASLVRLVTARRAGLLRCIAGVAENGESGALVIQATLTREGRLELVGVGVPEALPFDTVVECVRTELGHVTNQPIVAPASFEARVPFHFHPAPAAAPAPPVPI